MGGKHNSSHEVIYWVDYTDDHRFTTLRRECCICNQLQVFKKRTPRGGFWGPRLRRLRSRGGIIPLRPDTTVVRYSWEQK